MQRNIKNERKLFLGQLTKLQQLFNLLLVYIALPQKKFCLVFPGRLANFMGGPVGNLASETFGQSFSITVGTISRSSVTQENHALSIILCPLKYFSYKE